MIVDQAVSSVELALFHANVIRQFKALNPQQNMDAILREEFGASLQSAYFPATANLVAMYIAGNNSRRIVYLGGIADAAQATQLVLGYAGTLGLQFITGPNNWIRNNLPEYMSRVASPPLLPSEHLDLVGYSAGGAVATAMFWQLKQQGDLRKRKLITFGSPKPGGTNVRDQLVNAPVARWMTPADPIPLVPPTIQDAPQFAAIVPVATMVAWSQVVHTQGGVVVKSDGTTMPSIYPPDAVVTPGTSLANWMFSLDGADSGPHHINTYAAYLQAANVTYDTPRTKTRDLAGGDDADAEKRKGVNRQRDRVVAAVREAQHQQNIQIANHPAIVLFKPKRIGRIWAVEFGDKIVCQGVREDTCRHLCRAGNDFLKSLPKQGLVDPIALNAQFEQFLGFASDPATEWVPKLKTQIQF